MEAFSDGVFSIAATLLVLEIALHPPGTALEQLRHEWPAYLGYAISFPEYERVFITLYGLTLLAIRLLIFALDEYARRERLYSQDEADEDLRTERRQLWPVLAAYVVAILAGLALPRLAVGCTSPSPCSSSCRSKTSDAFSSAAHNCQSV